MAINPIRDRSFFPISRRGALIALVGLAVIAMWGGFLFSHNSFTHLSLVDHGRQWGYLAGGICATAFLAYILKGSQYTLLWAARERYTWVAQLLLALGMAHGDTRDGKGKATLEITHDPEIATALARYGAQPTVEELHRTLLWAEVHGHTQLLDALAPAGTPVPPEADKRAQEIWKAYVILAIEAGRKDVVEELHKFRPLTELTFDKLRPADLDKLTLYLNTIPRGTGTLFLDETGTDWFDALKGAYEAHRTDTITALLRHRPLDAIDPQAKIMKCVIENRQWDIFDTLYLSKRFDLNAPNLLLSCAEYEVEWASLRNTGGIAPVELTATEESTYRRTLSQWLTRAIKEQRAEDVRQHRAECIRDRGYDYTRVSVLQLAKEYVRGKRTIRESDVCAEGIQVLKGIFKTFFARTQNEEWKNTFNTIFLEIGLAFNDHCKQRKKDAFSMIQTLYLPNSPDPFFSSLAQWRTKLATELIEQHTRIWGASGKAVADGESVVTRGYYLWTYRKKYGLAVSDNEPYYSDMARPLQHDAFQQEFEQRYETMTIIPHLLGNIDLREKWLSWCQERFSIVENGQERRIAGTDLLLPDGNYDPRSLALLLEMKGILKKKSIRPLA